MARLTEEQLINEVMHLHSLHRQGPHPSNPNPPTFNPNPYSIYPITHPINPISNPNHTPHSPILNSNPSSIYPISNPNHIPISPIFNPRPSSIYPNNNPSIPVLNPDHIPNTHIFNHVHSSMVPTIPNSDLHHYSSTRVSNVPISNVYPFLRRNVECLNHNNLNKKISRLSLDVQLTKPKKKKKKKGKKGVGSNEEAKKWPPISENEWPCNPIPEPTVGWPTLNLKPAVDRVLTEEENARLVASKSQQKALDVAREMFRESMDSDSEVEDCVSSDDDDDDVGDEDECEEYKFFSKVFTEDSELRCYYEKNCESGEFSCLVCVGIGQKVGKKFKDCVALVQHSITIAKTKKRQAHRAFGKVICKVLGWEIQKLPSTNLPKTCDSKGNSPHDPKEVAQDKKDSASEVLPDTAVSLTTDIGPELMVCEDTSMASDGNKSVDTSVNGIPSTSKK